MAKLTGNWTGEKSSIAGMHENEIRDSATNGDPLPSSSIGRCRYREWLKIDPYQNVLQPLVPTKKVSKFKVRANAER